MADLIVGGIILAIVGLAARHVYLAKKRGVKCIGCPEGCNCSAKENQGSSCGCGCGK